MAEQRTELYHRHRPYDLDGVVGQADAVRTIRGFGAKVPRSILLYGGSGTGKTTLARIIARLVGCNPDNKFDYHEINCGAIESPIDMVREINRDMSGSPLTGKALVWVLDEVQTFSKSKGAQEALLKILEDCGPKAYFFLCTTDPKKLIPTIRNRCTQIPTKQIAAKDLEGLVRRVAKAENAELDDRLVEKIVEYAGGSARKALVDLEKVIGIKDPKERMSAIQPPEEEVIAFELVKALMPFRGDPQWPDVAKVLSSIKDEEPEGIRQMVLASARTNLLKCSGNMGLCYKTIKCLAEPLWDKNSGHALLAAGCYQVCFGK